MSMPFLLGRVAARIGVALWRHRLGLIAVGLLVAGASAYELTSAGASESTTGEDCADMAMAALTRTTDATARAAYDCLGPSMRTTNEDQFVASLQRHATPQAQADRVADKQTPSGKIVFYTVSGLGADPVGYIVYLDQNGKIDRVE
jgi:hypothetical protein